MKTQHAKRGFSVPVILMGLALIIIVGVIMWPKGKSEDTTSNTQNTDTVTQPTGSAVQPPTNDIPAITQSDIAQGWYYGDANQKKSGTPSTWLLRNAGTRSAQWYDPSKN